MRVQVRLARDGGFDSGWWRHRLLMALACAIGVAVELLLLMTHPYGRTSARGRHQELLTAFGDGAPVAQEFTAEADGLRAIVVRLAAPRPAAVALRWRLSRLQQGQWREVAETAASVPRFSGARWEWLAFAPIADSAGAAFQIEITAAPAPGASVAVVASRDKPLPYSYLTVGAREQWGDLVFDTRADADTLWGRMRSTVLPRLPAMLRHVWPVAAALLLFNAAAVALLQALLRAGARVAADASTSTRFKTVTAKARLGTMAAAMAVIAAAGATSLAGASTHGLVDLDEHLDDAALWTSWPLHEAFGHVDVQIGWSRRRAIFAHAPSRMTWHLTVPAETHLRTAVALEPEAWDHSSDGVVFRIQAVQDGEAVELLSRLVDPRRVASDRQWIPVDLDLTRFSGRPFDLELLTDPSLPDRSPDVVYDWAVWAAPRVAGPPLLVFDPDRLTVH